MAGIVIPHLDDSTSKIGDLFRRPAWVRYRRIRVLSRCRPCPDAMNPGDSSGEAIPVPIPNTAVKLSSAEDTERAAFRENRSSPGFFAFPGGTTGLVLRDRTGILIRMVDFDTTHPRPTSPTAPPTHAVCPYLLAPDGRWRSASPARDHRCTAVVPGAILAAEKQRRLCLVSEHRDCATYRVATGAGTTEGRPPGEAARAARPARRDLVRTAPLVMDHGRFPVSVQALVRERGFGQGALLALMAVAFAAILFARLTSGDGGDSGGVLAELGTPGARASATPTSSPAPAVTPAPVRTLVPPAAEPTAAPTAVPTSTVTAAPIATAAPTTYKVRRGDTLSGIAAEFGTTVKTLSEINGIDDPSRLRVGQVLKLP